MCKKCNALADKPIKLDLWFWNHLGHLNKRKRACRGNFVLVGHFLLDFLLVDTRISRIFTLQILFSQSSSSLQELWSWYFVANENTFTSFSSCLFCEITEWTVSLEDDFCGKHCWAVIGGPGRKWGHHREFYSCCTRNCYYYRRETERTLLWVSIRILSPVQQARCSKAHLMCFI